MITKITHAAFAHPDRSCDRNRSANTVIRIQIQMKNRKNHSIDRNTCPVPNSAANVTTTSVSGAAMRRQPTSICNTLSRVVLPNAR